MFLVSFFVAKFCSLEFKCSHLHFSSKVTEGLLIMFTPFRRIRNQQFYFPSYNGPWWLMNTTRRRCSVLCASGAVFKGMIYLLTHLLSHVLLSVLTRRRRLQRTDLSAAGNDHGRATITDSLTWCLAASEQESEKARRRVQSNEEEGLEGGQEGGMYGAIMSALWSGELETTNWLHADMQSLNANAYELINVAMTDIQPRTPARSSVLFACSNNIFI